jgi:hypothetical protein
MPPTKQDGQAGGPVRSFGRTFASADPERVCEVAGDAQKWSRSRQKSAAQAQQAQQPRSLANTGRSASTSRARVETDDEGGSGRRSR